MQTTYWIGTQPDPDQRRQIDVNLYGSVLIESVLHGERERATVSDYATGQAVTVERADCGLGCRCALDFVR